MDNTELRNQLKKMIALEEKSTPGDWEPRKLAKIHFIERPKIEGSCSQEILTTEDYRTKRADIEFITEAKRFFRLLKRSGRFLE